MNMVEDDVNNYDEDKEIYEENGYPTGELNGTEATVDKNIPRIENAGTGVNRLNVSFDD